MTAPLASCQRVFWLLWIFPITYYLHCYCINTVEVNDDCVSGRSKRYGEMCCRCGHFEWNGGCPL